MTGRLRTSRGGLELIKSFEGFRDTAIRLADGRFTIGYGHVRTAREGLVITQKDAEDLLVYDLGPIEAAINSMIFAPLNQNQFDALASLVFNISPGQFRDSDILAYLNGGDFLSAANAFDVWRKARIHGRVMVVDALVRRRAAEKAMFLEHPDGRPSAPTPLVSPTRDTSGEDTARSVDAAGKPRPVERQAEIQPTPPVEDRAPPVDIAEAVRRLAERTNQIIAQTGGRSPPEAQFEETRPEEKPVQTVETAEELVDVPVEQPPAPQPQPQTQAPRSADEIEKARREVADRVARILERTERAIAEQTPEPAAAQPAVQAPAAEPVVTPRPQVKPAARPAPEKITREIPEDLPDFDKPAEPRIRPSSNGRKLIDDTEIVDPGRDPALIFAEAEKKAKIVNGRVKRLGVINGRWAALWPWAFILVLSGVGFAIGLVNTFGDATAEEVRGAATVLAVFGMMLLMSLYFIVTRAGDTEG